jgi:hypothetical protein
LQTENAGRNVRAQTRMCCAAGGGPSSVVVLVPTRGSPWRRVRTSLCHKHSTTSCLANPTFPSFFYIVLYELDELAYEAGQTREHVTGFGQDATSGSGRRWEPRQETRDQVR